MLKKVFLGGAVVAASVFSVGAQASILIDDYTVKQIFKVSEANRNSDPDKALSDNLGESSDFANTRFTLLKNETPEKPSTGSRESSLIIENGTSTINNATGMSTKAQMKYESKASEGFDFTGVETDNAKDVGVYSAFVFHVEAGHDFEASVLTLFLTDSSGLEKWVTHNSSQVADGGSPFDLAFMHADFTSQGIVLSRVTDIRLEIDAKSNADFSFSQLGSYGEEQELPEPTTLALFGLGLAGISRIRSKKTLKKIS